MFRAVLAVLLLSSFSCWSQSYPARPVKIVVPFARRRPGRHLCALPRRQAVGKPRPAVRGREPPRRRLDRRHRRGGEVGRPTATRCSMMSNTHTVNETLIPKKPFDLMKDLAPISGVNYSDLLLVVHPSVPANNLKRVHRARQVAARQAQLRLLRAAARRTTWPASCSNHMAGVDIVHVPHKGSDQARTAVLGGQVQMMFDAITTMAGAGARRQGEGARHLRQDALARSRPTCRRVAEAGVPGYEATIWLGLMAPAGTPRPVLEQAQRRSEQGRQLAPR